MRLRDLPHYLFISFGYWTSGGVKDRRQLHLESLEADLSLQEFAVEGVVPGGTGNGRGRGAIVARSWRRRATHATLKTLVE